MDRLLPPEVEAGVGSGGRDPHAGLKARRLLRADPGDDLLSP
jgi:hypothetical protein